MGVPMNVDYGDTLLHMEFFCNRRARKYLMEWNGGIEFILQS